MLVLYIMAVEICLVQTVVVLVFDLAWVSLSQHFLVQLKHFVPFVLPAQGRHFCCEPNRAPMTSNIKAIYKRRPTHARTCLPKLYLQVLCTHPFWS